MFKEAMFHTDEIAGLVEGAGKSRPHRRVQHPEAAVLSAEVVGPFKPGKGKEKFMLVAAYTMVKHVWKEKKTKDGVKCQVKMLRKRDEEKRPKGGQDEEDVKGEDIPIGTLPQQVELIKRHFINNPGVPIPGPLRYYYKEGQGIQSALQVCQD